MSAPVLHVFAVNADAGDLRHTHLTRAQGEMPDLPPLGDWLGLETLDTDEIELFPLKDLGDMSLSDYVTMAFAPETPIAPEVRARLDALGGSVLLTPGAAMDGAPRPGRELTEIAALRLAEPDHDGRLPKADVSRPHRPEASPVPDDEDPAAPRRRWLVIAILAVATLAILLSRLL